MDLRTENKYMMFLIKVMFDKLLDYRRQIDELKAKVKIANDSKPDWITVKGNHIPVDEGENKQDVAKEFVESKEGKQSNLDDLGPEYTKVKGQDAIRFLLKQRKGWVRDAFTRDDIGGISLIWGNDGMGLKHIIKRRTEQDIDTNEFLRDLGEVIEKSSNIRKNEKGRFEIRDGEKIAVINPEITNGKLTFLLTAFIKGKR